MQQYSISWEPKTRREEKEIYDYYEVRKEGLGDEFLNELERVETLLTKHPKIAQIKYKNRRHISLKRFPHKIVFLIDENKKNVQILAIIHHKQNRTI